MTAMTEEKRVSDLLPCPLCDIYLRKAVDPMLSGMLEHPANLHCPISAVAFTDTSSNRAAWNRRSQQEPDGWRLVPVEPTREMILAAEAELENQTDSDYDSDADGNRYPYSTRRPGWEAHVYAAMLAAAPSPKEGK